MNRNDRIRIKRACADFDRSIREAVYIFNNEVESMKEEEEEKLDRLPSQLRDSSKGDQLDETARQLSDVLDKIESISTSVDDVIDILEVKSKFMIPKETKKSIISPGRKGKSFHALFPEDLVKELKDESLRRGISVNELVCRTLYNELTRTDEEYVQQMSDSCSR